MSDLRTTRFDIGDVHLTRIPYVDTPVPHEVLSVDGADDVVDALGWAAPWMDDGQPVVGLAFWVIEATEATIVVDPVCAADEFIRVGQEAVTHQDAAFAALEASGVDIAEVDLVVLTHLDGIGMVALADGGEAGKESWRPAFPNARVIVSEAELATVRDEPDTPGRRAFQLLDEFGIVSAVPVPHELAPGVVLRPTAGHGPGHCLVEIVSRDDRAVLLGHLALSPLHAALGVVDSAHVDAPTAWAALDTELRRSAVDGTVLTASLWPTPGAARVTERDPYVLEPIG